MTRNEIVKILLDDINGKKSPKRFTLASGGGITGLIVGTDCVLSVDAIDVTTDLPKRVPLKDITSIEEVE